MKQIESERSNQWVWLSLIVIAVMFVMAAIVWARIPAGVEVCIHWNLQGECDDMGNKFFSTFLIPSFMLGMLGLFRFMYSAGPRAENIKASGQAFHTIWASFLLFFFGFHGLLLLEISGIEPRLMDLWPLPVGVILIVVGNAMKSMKSNYYMGIRTPWTLSSEKAWTETHRLGGNLFSLIGVLFMGSAVLFDIEAAFIILMSSILLLLVIVMVYSYNIWKDDPDKDKIGEGGG